MKSETNNVAELTSQLRVLKKIMKKKKVDELHINTSATE